MPQRTRRLAAIMFTDIVGYSALVHKDEELSQELLNEHNSLLRSIFSRFDGTEVKTIGDAFHLEFPSTLQACECAIEIQKALSDRNSTLPRDRSIQIRIGIHVGDVLPQAGDVFGDTVNIASRIEPLAEPGGICISEDVVRQIRNKIDRPVISLGKRVLKNIESPVEVFRIGEIGEEATPLEPIPSDKSRIAVLPFSNISPDMNDEYFADGMHEEIIASLSKIHQLRVISRTSVMQYKSTRKGMIEIGRALKVGAILEGSVRKAGDQLRITMQLIDVSSDEHLWSEQYDRKLEDIFAIQSEVSQQVAEAMKVQLLADEQQMIDKPPTQNMEAYLLYLRARFLLDTRTEEGIRNSIDLYEEALKLDPDYGLAYSGLANAWNILAQHGYIPIEIGYPKAEEYTHKALKLDDRIAEVHVTLGSIEADKWNWAKAETHFKRAVELNPSSSTAHQMYALPLLFLGRFDEALEEITQARHLDSTSFAINYHYALILLNSGRFEDTLQFCEEISLLFPSRFHFYQGAAHMYMGIYDIAEQHLADMQEAEKGVTGRIIADSFLGITYALMGEIDKAKDLAANLELPPHHQRQWVPIAFIYWALGDLDKAFQAFDKGFKERDPWLSFMKIVPLHDVLDLNIRSDPRFKELMQEMHLT